MPRTHRVSWHPKGRWCFTKSIDGKRRYFYASAEIPNTPAGRRKAVEWMEGVLRELEDRVVTGEDWTLNDLRLAYLTWCKRRTAERLMKPHTFNGHRKHLNLICRATRSGKTYGQFLARELTTKAIGDLVKAWKTPTKDREGNERPGKGATTIRNRLGSLQAMLNWASSPRDDRPIERLIPANPIAGYELPKAEYQGDRYAPAEEVEAFLAWLDDRAAKVEGFVGRFERLTARLVRMAAETGARPGELCALEWRHYDADQRVILFPPDEHKTGGKTKRPRLVLITPELAAMLEEIRSDPKRHPSFVFTHSVRRKGSTEAEREQGAAWNSNALSRRIKILRREAIAAGLKLEDKGVKRMHLYRLRHTHITSAMQSPEKPSIVDVATMHGTSVKMIETTYLHTQVSHLHGVLERLKGAKPTPSEADDSQSPPPVQQDHRQ